MDAARIPLYVVVRPSDAETLTLPAGSPRIAYTDKPSNGPTLSFTDRALAQRVAFATGDSVEICGKNGVPDTARLRAYVADHAAYAHTLLSRIEPHRATVGA